MRQVPSTTTRGGEVGRGHELVRVWNLVELCCVGVLGCGSCHERFAGDMYMCGCGGEEWVQLYMFLHRLLQIFSLAKLISLEANGFDWQLGQETNAIHSYEGTPDKENHNCVDAPNIDMVVIYNNSF
jgi:hypothetical protein